VEVHPGDQEAFEKVMEGAPFSLLGHVTTKPMLSITGEDETLVRLPVEDLVKAWGPQ